MSGVRRRQRDWMSRSTVAQSAHQQSTRSTPRGKVENPAGNEQEQQVRGVNEQVSVLQALGANPSIHTSENAQKDAAQLCLNADGPPTQIAPDPHALPYPQEHVHIMLRVKLSVLCPGWR